VIAIGDHKKGSIVVPSSDLSDQGVTDDSAKKKAAIKRPRLTLWANLPALRT
jgi:hypothetical protein